MGTHPLAGTYHDKQDFIAHTFTRLNRVLRDGVLLRVTHTLVSGDTAAVELEALSTTIQRSVIFATGTAGSAGSTTGGTGKYGRTRTLRLSGNFLRRMNRP